MLLGLVARQRHQPGFGLRRDDRFFARPWSILDCRQRPISQRPLHAALNRLMMNPNSLPHRTERRILAIGQQHLRPRYPARRLGSRPRKSLQSFNLFVGYRQFDYSPPSCHDAAPRFANRKRGIRHQPIGSMTQVSWNRSSSFTPSTSSLVKKSDFLLPGVLMPEISVVRLLLHDDLVPLREGLV